MRTTVKISVFFKGYSDYTVHFTGYYWFFIWFTHTDT